MGMALGVMIYMIPCLMGCSNNSPDSRSGGNSQQLPAVSLESLSIGTVMERAPKYLAKRNELQKQLESSRKLDKKTKTFIELTINDPAPVIQFVASPLIVRAGYVDASSYPYCERVIKGKIAQSIGEDKEFWQIALERLQEAASKAKGPVG
jgi:hypothetical protein